MEIILKNVQKKHLPLINELARMLKVKVETPDDSPYDPDFVASIKKAEEDIENGRGVKIPVEDLWK